MVAMISGGDGRGLVARAWCRSRHGRRRIIAVRFAVAGNGYAPWFAATVAARRRAERRRCRAFFWVIFGDARQPWGETYVFWPILVVMLLQGVIIRDYHAFYFKNLKKFNLYISMYYHST
ncbi:hypothetical protein PQU96_12940 [Vogesella sp. LYT5W]|uniref:Uncharacterized protein n=1 Tax=Vogesella margarita TaxID=2984199 RepID=A0ABT5IR18_9NEIS|nr:hypothetical protein [Vogesella margarita]MDC7715020.1 hypothetical protein [Vogesella margarita]